VTEVRRVSGMGELVMWEVDVLWLAVELMTLLLLFGGQWSE